MITLFTYQTPEFEKSFTLPPGYDKKSLAGGAPVER
jgi:hypothetical protein